MSTVIYYHQLYIVLVYLTVCHSFLSKNQLSIHDSHFHLTFESLYQVCKCDCNEPFRSLLKQSTFQYKYYVEESL